MFFFILECTYSTFHGNIFVCETPQLFKYVGFQSSSVKTCLPAYTFMETSLIKVLVIASVREGFAWPVGDRCAIG